MRKGIGKVTNELTNPDSHLRTGQIRNGSAFRPAPSDPAFSTALSLPSR